MKGFKSFARETVILLDRHVNVVVGPNGSGKSNVTDALCFVLGRLSIKSMRAAKASHLIFSGNKNFKGANLAYVEITWDNSKKTFSVDEDEVVIRRIVKKNGQGIYKINGIVRTRQEVLELLSQAGIDPHGFNIVLQGEIEKFVKMPGEERRKVIEEVAGISVYEMRKEKSLKELEKTNEKLKQINAVLRERTNYLRNLENEREQALRFKKFEETVQKCKASIINRNMQEKENSLNFILKNISDRVRSIEKKDILIKRIHEDMVRHNGSIESITKTIQDSSGLEQDSLLNEISILKQEIAGLIARKESYQNNLVELDRRKRRLEEDIQGAEKEIEEMSQEKGKNKKRDLDEKKKKLDDLESVKRNYFILKSNLATLNSQIEDKKRNINGLKNESNFILNQIEQIEVEIKIKDNLEGHLCKVEGLKKEIEAGSLKVESVEDELLEREKICAVNFQLIQESEKIKSQVSKLDECPLCKTNITEEHVDHVVGKADLDINGAKDKIDIAEKDIIDFKKSIIELKAKVILEREEVNVREICIVKLANIKEKKEKFKRDSEQIVILENEIKSLDEKRKNLDGKISSTRISEEQYESLKLEVNELQRSEERNLGSEITMKQRELDRAKLAIKQNVRDREDIVEEMKDIVDVLGDKQDVVERKEEQAEVLKKKYQKMFEQKNLLQDKVRGFESEMMKEQNEKRLVETEINNLNIEKAQNNGRIETFKEELVAFEGVEFINLPVDKLKEKLQNCEMALARIGNVNLRALEVYDDIKAEYERIKNKVEQLETEKDEILKIIEQIDKKKKKVFANTLQEVNATFSDNFSKLSTKGIVSLDPQNKKEVFDGGLDIIVKVGAGKYFDITSLSGGEQTLVALSLIFAIQDFRPYCFYIFDEIDAALDRRNSERLAYLLKKHMNDGQYLMITHNDSIISDSSNLLYGISMQDGVSKVLSLEV